MKPRVSILSRRFKYRSAAATDVRKTWRESQRREETAAKADNVTSLPFAKANR